MRLLVLLPLASLAAPSEAGSASLGASPPAEPILLLAEDVPQNWPRYEGEALAGGGASGVGPGSLVLFRSPHPNQSLLFAAACRSSSRPAGAASSRA